MALKNNIEFKGTKDGLIIHFNEACEYEKLKEQLIEKIENARSFFKGARIAGIEGKSLSSNEESEIIDLINNRYGMIMVEKPITLSKKEEVFMGLDEGITRFIKSTVRSGIKIEFKGNLVIMGDVNPGAEVVAYGNIVVMGTLRGTAHAGANGNNKAFVSAIKLVPTQLRIGKFIARAPDNGCNDPKYPEKAFIKDDMIQIEPYITKSR
ncbi:septum site-determining protein MinC [Paramaledivibacter caminithermalis]|jgi:septum site-determining protein MinC|uniref:Probable septum site-determining protein MinC n=1 Tax=Paramaledivibacter caminithermalis (strain DSM 15212 / CIP 107654 / DViRD3) TaxID=1121301 RepID=A0A1M6MFG8_PARC5|nr:septum site-determining protein MinC [Paramaledivibacter caminithermalis]SHJ82187.1 septum site-determining protein MinC [Paramaledivibacter caminithermalis DSM 15212]